MVECQPDAEAILYILQLSNSPKEAQQIADQWLDEYNDERPHGGLGMLTRMNLRNDFNINKLVDVEKIKTLSFKLVTTFWAGHQHSKLFGYQRESEVFSYRNIFDRNRIWFAKRSNREIAKE